MEASALQAPLGLGRISISSPLLRLRSDDQLVALFRSGNDEAFRVIHDRYRQRLFAYARQMLCGSRQDAEDALQDVFIRAYSSLRANDRPIALRAWLYRVAHNRCIDQLRRPVPPPADVFDASRAPMPDPLAEAERREDLRRLIDDVRRLPEQQRSVLLMRELEGLSYAELGDALGTTVPAIKSLLVRARLGLVQSAEARDTTCHEIRTDLALAHGRGVRANGRARRHMRDCPGCREYRGQLRTVQRGFGALVPASAGLLAKLTGIGGGGGAAAGSGAAAGGGGLLGGGAATATLTATKVCAVVCSVVVTAGGAVQVERQIVGTGDNHGSSAAPPAHIESAPAATGTSGLTQLRQASAETAKPKAPTAAAPTAATTTKQAATPTSPGAPAADTTPPATSLTGGTAAPDDPVSTTDPPTDSTLMTAPESTPPANAPATEASAPDAAPRTDTSSSGTPPAG
ncbi:MAG: hypothetical protein QOK04_54 [Solirubrobacteraceae bacterium]|nr:hypothetical protein [Solirubrobacteraceae bacterium]